MHPMRRAINGRLLRPPRRLLPLTLSLVSAALILLSSASTGVWTFSSSADSPRGQPLSAPPGLKSPFWASRARRGKSIPTCLVTGGTKGLGLAIATQMAQNGFQVVIAARNDTLAMADLKRLRLPHSHKRQVLFRQLDLQDPRSIENFCQWCESEGISFDVLFNNAGICPRSSDVEAARQTLAANYFGPKLLTERLFPQVKLADGDRLEVEEDSAAFNDTSSAPFVIINLSSSEGELGYLHSKLAKEIREAGEAGQEGEISKILEDLLENFDDDIEYAHGPTPFYSVSKAAVNAWTRCLARGDPDAQSYIVHAVCPGDVITRMVTPGQERFAQSPAEAAEHVVKLVLEPPVTQLCYGDISTGYTIIQDKGGMKSYYKLPKDPLQCTTFFDTGKFWRRGKPANW